MWSGWKIEGAARKYMPDFPMRRLTKPEGPGSI